MFLRFARCTAVAAAAASAALMPPQLCSAQTAPPVAAQTAPPAGAKPVPPATPAQPTSTTPQTPAIAPDGIETKPGNAFGEDITLTAQPIVYFKGSGTWDKAYAIISGSLKKVEAYVAKTGLKTDGLPMTIFLATDDRGFDYEAAVPLAAMPKDPPHGEIAAGQSPEGHALKFVHRGSYESLDDTYEAITDYLDEKRLESTNVLIEQYVTDPVTADEKNLVVNVLVPIK
jgi:effector-binding domain-containing protein